uniref:Uncharacterized protein n=1 Tax=Cucumis melo TaxID=3656 RepID=A0A9I9ELV4_CUCME
METLVLGFPLTRFHHLYSLHSVVSCSVNFSPSTRVLQPVFTPLFNPSSRISSIRLACPFIFSLPSPISCSLFLFRLRSSSFSENPLSTSLITVSVFHCPKIERFVEGLAERSCLQNVSILRF